MGKRLNLLDDSLLAFVWIIDPPLVEWSEEEGRWDGATPSTAAPKIALLARASPGAGQGRGHPTWCRNVTLRKLDPLSTAPTTRVFELLGYSEEETNARFGHLLNAFEYGAPPHGGVAPGIQRIILIILSTRKHSHPRSDRLPKTMGHRPDDQAPPRGRARNAQAAHQLERLI